MRKIFASAPTIAVLVITLSMSACSGVQSKGLTSAPQCAKVTQPPDKPESVTRSDGTSITVYHIDAELVDGASSPKLISRSRAVVLGWPKDNNKKVSLALTADYYQITCAITDGKTSKLGYDDFTVAAQK